MSHLIKARCPVGEMLCHFNFLSLVFKWRRRSARNRLKQKSSFGEAGQYKSPTFTRQHPGHRDLQWAGPRASLGHTPSSPTHFLFVGSYIKTTKWQHFPFIQMQKLLLKITYISIETADRIKSFDILLFHYSANLRIWRRNRDAPLKWITAAEKVKLIPCGSFYLDYLDLSNCFTDI